MTASLLVLVGIMMLTLAVHAFSGTRRVKTALGKVHGRNQMPKMITALVISVQFSELVRIVDHASTIHVVGALLLLVVMLATKAGTEGELIH